MKITLEQVDKVIDRTAASYEEAKEALESTHGDVLDAIIFIEKNRKVENKDKKKSDNREAAETVEDIKAWLKDIINKGNVARIKILKEENIIADVPVNAGLAAGVIAILIPAILAFVVVAAVVTKITVEITMVDGSVEVINKYVYKAVDEAKNKTVDIADKVKSKVGEINIDDISSMFKRTIIDENIANTDKKNKKYKVDEKEVTTFKYTVNFDEE